MIDYSRMLREKVKNSTLALQLMIFQILNYQQTELDIVHLLGNSTSLPAKIIAKIESVLSESQYIGASPYQLAIHFLQLLIPMIEAGYNQGLAFIFCIVWTYGFSIEEKRLEEIFK